MSVFDDPTIGGIAESFPVEWDKEKITKGNTGYKMVAYSSFLWLKFQKEKFTYKNGNFRYLKEPTMFLTNIFRKELYKKNLSLGDDFERTKDIMDRGRKVVIFNDIKIPRMIATYNKIFVKDLFKQKVRTAIARKQLNQNKIMKINFFNYYLPSSLFIFSHALKRSFYVGFIVLLWSTITFLGEIIARFIKTDTKRGWALRAKR